MSNIELTITPTWDEVRGCFNDIPPQLDKEFDKTLAKIAFLIEGKAKERSPVRTGKMKASIFSHVGHLQATIMPTVNYAIFVHEGTRFMRARPFLLWGVQDAQPDIQGLVGDSVHIAVRTAMGQ